jgi:CRP-like cAMP-binding protein
MNTSLEILVSAFFDSYTKLKYKKGEVVLRAGDPPAGVMYLKSGFVRQSFTSASGDTLVLHVYKPGSYFPMTWVINDTPNRYDFEALTPVTMMRAPKADVRKFLAEHPEVSEHFMSRILLGVSGLLSRMEHLILDSAYQKTVLLLIYHARAFADEKAKGKLSVPLTHKEIASWIGTTRETASLQIEALKKKNLISYDRRHIIIPDVEALVAESEKNF